MVAAPYIEKQIRNYKTRKNKIRDKNKSKTYHVFEALLRWRQKYGGKHNKPVTKKGQTGKQTHGKKSCHGSKGPFHGNMVRKRKKNTKVFKFFMATIYITELSHNVGTVLDKKVRAVYLN